MPDLPGNELPSLTQTGSGHRPGSSRATLAAVAGVVVGLIVVALMLVATASPAPEGAAPGPSGGATTPTTASGSGIVGPVKPGGSLEGAKTLDCSTGPCKVIDATTVATAPSLAELPPPNYAAGELLPGGTPIEFAELPDDCLHRELAKKYSKEDIVRFSAMNPQALRPSDLSRVSGWLNDQYNALKTCDVKPPDGGEWSTPPSTVDIQIVPDSGAGALPASPPPAPDLPIPPAPAK